jgi:hypothetical protein
VLALGDCWCIGGRSGGLRGGECWIDWDYHGMCVERCAVNANAWSDLPQSKQARLAGKFLIFEPTVRDRASAFDTINACKLDLLRRRAART